MCETSTNVNTLPCPHFEYDVSGAFDIIERRKSPSVKYVSGECGLRTMQACHLVLYTNRVYTCTYLNVILTLLFIIHTKCTAAAFD